MVNTKALEIRIGTSNIYIHPPGSRETYVLRRELFKPKAALNEKK